MPGLLINGVDAETLGFTLAESPGWLDAPPREFPTAPVSGRPGATALANPTEGVRQVTLTGTVRASTVASGRSKVDALKLALLANPLALTFADNSTRRVYARLKSFATQMVQGAQGPFAQENLAVTAVLTALDPLSYDIAQSTIAIGTRLPLGTGPIRPIVTISGASVNPIISLFNTAGVVVASITITITTILGDTLVVDMDAKTVKKNGVSSIASVTAGDFFSIEPADQVNFGGAGPWVGTTSGAGDVRYYKSWR
jgi:phage-related protein